MRYDNKNVACQWWPNAYFDTNYLKNQKELEAENWLIGTPILCSSRWCIYLYQNRNFLFEVEFTTYLFSLSQYSEDPKLKYHIKCNDVSDDVADDVAQTTRFLHQITLHSRLVF